MGDGTGTIARSRERCIEDDGRLYKIGLVVLDPSAFARSLNAADQIETVRIFRFGECPLDKVFAGAPCLLIAFGREDSRVTEKIIRIHVDHIQIEIHCFLSEWGRGVNT